MNDHGITIRFETTPAVSSDSVPPLCRECQSCIITEIRGASALANLPDSATGEVLSFTAHLMANIGENRLEVPQLIREVTDEIIESSGAGEHYDIYKSVKVSENDRARMVLDEARAVVLASRDQLEMALKLSAAANLPQSVDLPAGEWLKQLQGSAFSRCNLVALKKRLTTARSLLFICSNSGEVVLDALLLETVKRLYPQITITAAVRHYPIGKSVLLDDAGAVGLSSVARVISSGSALPGTMLDICSAPFRKEFASTNLCIAKGLSNFATLADVSEEQVFFLFGVQCTPLAKSIGLKEGSLVLLQGGEEK